MHPMLINRFDSTTAIFWTIMERCSHQHRDRHASSSRDSPSGNIPMNPWEGGQECFRHVKVCYWASDDSLSIKSESAATSDLSPRAVHVTGVRHRLSVERIQQGRRPSGLKQLMPCNCNTCLLQAPTDILALSFLLKELHSSASNQAPS